MTTAKTSKELGWYSPKMITHNLEKFGHPELEYEAVDINSLVYGEMEKLLDLRSEIIKDDEKATGFIRQIVQRLFTGNWNITDPITGETLKPPKEDLNSYKQLPTEVILYMVGQVMGGTEEVVPPESGS